MRGRKKMEAEIKRADIDIDVKELMNDEEILASLEDEKMVRRFELNCFCELVSQLGELQKQVDALCSTVTMCAADKLNKFFKEVDTNIQTEKKIATIEKKIGESHKKPKQKTKKSVK